jgi:TPP-dependent pyruvate/acetoin dehydrogenase alpha subunit
VRDALKVGIEAKKPHIDELFKDVYDFIPKNLQEQRGELKAHLRTYGKEYELE